MSDWRENPDQEHTGEIIYLIWFGKTSGSARRSWKTLLARGTFGLFATLTQPGMDGWMLVVSANNGLIVCTLSPTCSFSYHPPPSPPHRGGKGTQTERKRSRSESAVTVKTNEGDKWSSCFLFC